MVAGIFNKIKMTNLQTSAGPNVNHLGQPSNVGSPYHAFNSPVSAGMSMSSPNPNLQTAVTSMAPTVQRPTLGGMVNTINMKARFQAQVDSAMPTVRALILFL